MMKGMYIAASGMNYQIDALNDVTGNLANVNTSGYKRTQVTGESFGSLVTQFANPTPFNQVGVGVRSTGHARIDTQGSLIKTSNPLHMALSGDGYFQTQNASGTVQITRNGDFRMDNQGYLASQTGDRVLGADNNPIQVGAMAGGAIRIRQDGMVMADGQPVARLKVVGAEAADNVTFPLSDINVPERVAGYTIEQGYLEGSNVNVIAEMVNMITINKAFTFGQKAITTQDNLLNKTVNDLGRVQ